MSTQSPKISIIVPVYKVEQYLPKCIDSILSQTYPNWELLLIDDGSPDNSGKICDEYAQKDERIRVFHKENGGVSSARNLGIENSIGEWILFIDSDDWVETHLFSIVDDKEDFDFIQFGFKRVCNGNIINYSKLPSQQIIIKQEEYCHNLYYHSGICGYIIKRHIIISNNIRFPLHIRYGEDQCFILKTLFHVKKIFISNNHYYNYSDNPNSAMNARWDYKRINDSLTTISDIAQYAESKSLNPAYIHKYMASKFAKSYIWQSIRLSTSIQDLCDIKKKYNDFIKNNSWNCSLKKYNNIYLLLFLYCINKFGIKR